MSDNEITQKNIPQKKRGPMGGMGGPMGMMGGGQKAKNFKKSIGKLVKYLKSYLVMIILAMIFTITATVLTILAAPFVGKITEELFKSMGGGLIDLGTVGTIAVSMIIYYGLSAIFNYIQSFIMAQINQGVTKKLRTEISKKINKVPLKYYDTNSYGDVLSRVTNDVDTIGQTLNQSISTMVYSITMLIGVLIAMFVTCWQLGLTAVAIVPVSMIIMLIIIKFSQKYFIAQQTHLGALNGHIEEMYSGQNVVKAFNGEEKAQKSYDKINQKLYTNARKAQFLSGTMMPIMNFVSNLGYVAICVVGAILFIDGKISVGIINIFIIYLNLFQNPLFQIAQAFNNLQSTAAAAERVFEFLEEKEQDDESDKIAKIKNIKGAVEFRNVKFGYDENKIIIKNFSASVKPGQKIAIVGPTGAGKTTIVNLLMRFYELNDGEILIDGVPISNMKREEVRGMFGMVLQDTWLFNGSIKENIIYSKQGITDGQVIEAGKAANIDHYINTLPNGYNMVLDDDTNISSGQRQLLTIARAMVQNSPMLILDEATSSVDTRTEHHIQDAMDKLTKGRTSFVIAHRLSTIKNADMILVMKDGDIIEKGNHEELLKLNGFYSELYNSQFEQNQVVE